MLDVRWKTVAVLVGQKFERLNMSLASILARSDHLILMTLKVSRPSPSVRLVGPTSPLLTP
jgi:hypothetical protein